MSKRDGPTTLDAANSAQKQLWNGVARFIVELNKDAGWREHTKRRMEYVLNFDDRLLQVSPDEGTKEFKFSDEIEKKKAVVLTFVALSDSVSALKECEYYFRRYPFRGLPVSRSRHLVHVCEMYYDRFYEIRERLKNVLNAANEITENTAPSWLDVRHTLKSYDKEFGQELRMRNSTHHRERFDYVAINRLSLTERVHSDTTDEELSSVLRRGQETEYRRLTREWAERVRHQGKWMDDTLEKLAQALLIRCKFLADDAEPRRS